MKMIIEHIQPKIIALCETKLSSGRIVKNTFPEYIVCPRTKKSGEKGMALCVRMNTFKSVLDVTSCASNDIIAVRIEMASCVVRIILAYAPQENDDAEVRENFYDELELEITNCKLAEELPIVVGDLNAKIEEKLGKLEALTSNGNHLLQIIDNQQLDVLNFHQQCYGKWTHVIRTTKSSSVLDYVLTTREVTNTLESVTIDEECLMCPFSIKKNKKSEEQQFSDHNAIVVKLKMGHEKKRVTNTMSWRITDDGLQKLAQLTNDSFGSAEGDNTQAQYDKFERNMKEVMNECFKIRKDKKNNQIDKQFSEIYSKITMFSRKGKAQRRVAREYIKTVIAANTEKVATRQKLKIKETVQNLTVNNTFSPDRFWNLCKRARKSTNSAGTAVETEDGRELYGDDMILDAYMNEFKHRLRKREIDQDLTNYESRTELLCKLHLQGVHDSPPYTSDELEKVRKNLKKGKSSGRDNLPSEVFINGGVHLQQSILDLFNFIKQENGMPHQWTKVQVSTMYKHKGKRNRLVNQRGIFLKQVLSKMYGKLNMNRASNAMEGIDKSQAGGRLNRSTADQTYMLRAAVDHSIYLDQPLFITLYDYSQCFDSLWLSDCLLSLIKVGVDKKIVSILQKLNESCKIVVKTPVGLTEEFEMKAIVQQGSVSGGALCIASTAEISEQDLGKGCQIGMAILKALAFVDDIATLSRDHVDAYKSHQCVEWFSAKKRLLLNALKCLLLCINVKKNDVIPRLKIDETALKEVCCATYLGDIFNTAGNSNDLIEDRVKKAKACTINALSICSEITMGTYTIQTLLLLYHSIFLAVVLYNAQAWSRLSPSNINKLQVVQMSYLKRMMHAPTSTSNTITLLETGVTPIENEIHIKQLTFLHHILTLEDDDPVRVTYTQQLKYEFEHNWANEVSQLRHKYGIEESDEDIKQIHRETWKRQVKTKVRAYVANDLKKKVAQQKLGKNLLYSSDLTTQNYLTKLPSANARKVFHIRSGTIDLRSHRRYKYGNNSSCRLCGYHDECVDHVVNECPAVHRERTLNVLNGDSDELLEVSRRCIQFDELVDEVESLESC